MDYWRHLDLCLHENWNAFKASSLAPSRLWLFTTRATQSFWSVVFKDGDGLVFGNEGHGAPEWLHEEVGDAHRITIPQAHPDLRSLNLATAAGIATYEALRQIRG